MKTSVFVVMVAAAPAGAGIHYSFQAGSFDDPSVSSLSGSFDYSGFVVDGITGETTVFYDNLTVQLALTSGSVITFTPADTGYVYNGFVVDSVSGSLTFLNATFGGTINGVGTLLPGSFDFLVNVGDLVVNPVPVSLTTQPLVSVQVTTAEGAAVSTGSGLLTVPMPGTLAVLGAGGLLVSRRRRRA
ncbi:MAG: hypothetical protein KDA21_06675 [Phycisphaerales bacterium]|nr:hypothetical protein [Phycisphaerales bacterium]